MFDKKKGIFKYKNKIFYNMLPYSFEGLLTEHQSNSSYNTGFKGDYQFHIQMRTVLNTSFEIWNNLPKYVKHSKSIVNLKEFFYHLTTHDRLAIRYSKYTLKQGFSIGEAQAKSRALSYGYWHLTALKK